MYCLMIMLKLCSKDERKELLSEEHVDISHFDKEFKNLWSNIRKNLKCKFNILLSADIFKSHFLFD